MERIKQLMEYLRQHNLVAVLIAIVFMALISILYFIPDDLQGNVLQQPDTKQGLAVGHEAKVFEESTGEVTHWTNSLFGGMPMFQISPSYPSNKLFSWITQFITLGLPSPANILFLMMIGFFILLLSMKMRWYVSLIGAIAWGFSSYFMILIGAGHIWKYLTLAYIPPTIAGVVLCYRGKYLWGVSSTALFGMLQLASNHVQMTYYFLFVVFGFLLYYFLEAKKTGNLKKWILATIWLIFAGILSISANLPSLYNTYEYSKETIRGKHTDLKETDIYITDNKTGLDKEYITQYSYEVPETFSLLIPNVKGGATNIPMKGEIVPMTLAQLDKTEEMYSKGEISPQTAQNLNYLYQYFGGREGTNGPVYVGALIVALFLLGCFIVKGPIKWILLGLTILSISLAWGRNFMFLTDFFIDYFPMYNKFRTPESILVIAQFTMPLLGCMALQQIFNSDRKESWQVYGKPIKWSFYSTISICLIGIIYPGIFGNVIPDYEIEMGINQLPELCETVKSLRYAIIRADALRTGILLILGYGVLLLYYKHRIKLSYSLIFIGILVLYDLFFINKRYVNHDCFMPCQSISETVFPMTFADKAILSDTSMNFRVMDFKRFASPDPSYYHKMIGGYHPAKLTRYQDMIEYYLSGERDFSNMLNMLNTRYIIEDPAKVPYYNSSAKGNAWLVDSVLFVGNANEEISQIENLDLSKIAVADRKFSEIIGEPIQKIQGDTIFETSYAPNRLTYRTKTTNGGTAVFSEVYFPWGWHATIDGEPVDIARVNYILRAVQLPSGEHTIEMWFDPESLHLTVLIAIISISMIYILLLTACVITIKRNFSNKREAFM